MKRILPFLKNNWLIFGIVILSLFLRLFKISSYMTFLGDEGRDVLVWLRMMHGKFTLIGPQTSIGNMYLGPLYYYLMFPFYILLGTVGPSIGVALFAGATTFMLWLFGKEWFSNKVGIISAFLYAISPIAIVLSRSSWNPNVMPFFALLIIWGVWQFWQKNNYKWIAIIGILLSFTIQSHYLGILLILVIGLFWLIKLRELTKKKEKINKFIYFSVLCALFFVLLSVAPLVWFDLRHNFINYKAFYKFFSERQTTVNFKPYKAIPQIWPLWKTLVTRLITGKVLVAGVIFSIIVGVGTIIKFSTRNKSYFLIVSWLLIGLLGMGLYKQHIYDHYFGFIFPALFLVTAILLEEIMKIKKYGKTLFVLTFFSLIILSLLQIPLRFSPSKQMTHVEEIDKKIILESKGKPFNLGLIAKQNYDTGYRYFLEKWGEKAVEIDAQRSKETITDTLFVVCEEKECNPTTHAQAEIANFGWSKIEETWEFPWGVKLFKLVHNENKK